MISIPILFFDAELFTYINAYLKLFTNKDSFHTQQMMSHYYILFAQVFSIYSMVAGRLTMAEWLHLHIVTEMPCSSVLQLSTIKFVYCVHSAVKRFSTWN